MNTVTIRHPELGEMQVHPLTVPSWRSRGWQVTEEQASAEPVKGPEEQESPRRRRSTKESE
jgi:hypothetical protein